MAFDAIIAGAGIIGSSIAWRLAQQRLRVLLVDAGRMGGEASSAGAGMLAPGGEIESSSPWSDFALASLRLYPEYVAELETETGCPIDFQRLGAVEVALSEEEWKSLEERGRRQSDAGIPSSALTARELAEELPLARRDLAGARFYPQDSLVDPRDILRALRAGCLRLGVQIREGTTITEIQPATGEAMVQAGGTRYQAAVVVLAAGAWSDQIRVKSVDLVPTYPVRGHLLAYRLPPASLGPILRHGPTYLLQRANGFTIAGTSSEQAGFDRTLSPAIVADIQSRAGGLLPALSGRRPDEQWLGFRPAVNRDTPIVGRAGETALWLAYGHYRNGILLAPETARRIASGIMANSERDLSARPGTP